MMKMSVELTFEIWYQTVYIFGPPEYCHDESKVHCNYAATCCNTLQHHCTTLQQYRFYHATTLDCNTLQHTATHCNTTAQRFSNIDFPAPTLDCNMSHITASLHCSNTNSLKP